MVDDYTVVNWTSLFDDSNQETGLFDDLSQETILDNGVPVWELLVQQNNELAPTQEVESLFSEMPTFEPLVVEDQGSHSESRGTWSYNMYHMVELTLKNTPIKIDQENWCKGNSKKEQSIDESLQTRTLYIYLTDAEKKKVQRFQRAKKPKCLSKNAKTMVQVSSERLLKPEDCKIQIQVRILCIPFHHFKVNSFLMYFVIKENGVDIATSWLEVGKVKANRSERKKSLQQGNFNPLVGIVLVFFKIVLTFRANWRIFTQQ